MSTAANYASTPIIGMGQVSVANTNRDGTGTLATIFTAGTSGSRIDSICIKALNSTTAGTIRLFIHDGTTAQLLTELPVIAITPSGVSPSFEVQLNTNTMTQVLPIIFQSGYSLRASTNNAETFNIIAQGGNF